LPDAASIRSVLSDVRASGAEVEETPLGVLCRVPISAVREALQALKGSDHAYDFMVDTFGSDTGEAIELTYHLRSFSRNEDVYVRAETPYGSTMLSVWDLFPAALMPERETAEMFRLGLEGHPNPKRLLTTEEGGDGFLLKSTEIRSAEEVRNR
jgi:NADH:ubiquinone oxidoreductase subunit C